MTEGEECHEIEKWAAVLDIIDDWPLGRNSLLVCSGRKLVKIRLNKQSKFSKI
jgi:hypothetical protein